MAKLTLSTGAEVIVEESRDRIYDLTEKNESENISLRVIYLTNSGKKESKSEYFRSDNIIRIEN